MRSIAVIGSLLQIAATGPAIGSDCEGWNTSEYFEMATVADVMECVAAGADPNARNESGETPLHVAAASNDNPAVIATLVDAGADPNARNKSGKTPLHEAAASNDNPAVFATLMDTGGRSECAGRGRLDASA